MRYAEEQKKYASLIYRPFLKDLKALNIKGDYLEIGAGPGLLSVLIADNNPDVRITTIDISPDMVAIADKLIRERKLEDRVRCLLGDANDKRIMRGLGKYDLVYSTFSLHHWQDPIRSISNLWEAVNENGMLYIYDLRRTWCLYYLPLKGGDIGSVRASYTPAELRAILHEAGVINYEIRKLFPLFLRLIARKNFVE